MAWRWIARECGAEHVSEEGIATDPYTRKAPYNYGWDWGPRYITEGIWGSVKLIAWDDYRIDNFHIRQVKVSKDEAELLAELVSVTPAGTVTLAVFASVSESVAVELTVAVSR